MKKGWKVDNIDSLYWYRGKNVCKYTFVREIKAICFVLYYLYITSIGSHDIKNDIVKSQNFDLKVCKDYVNKSYIVWIFHLFKKKLGIFSSIYPYKLG